jgi:type I site-specific restriction endonuclease
VLFRKANVPLAVVEAKLERSQETSSALLDAVLHAAPEEEEEAELVPAGA